MVDCLDAVWSEIDWSAPMWSNRMEAYNRFESRVRVASRASDLVAFLAILSRKCGVAVPRIPDSLASRLHEDGSGALTLARKYSGVMVAFMRARKEIRRASNQQTLAV